MSVKTDIQQAMKEAMKSKSTERLEVLRMAKGALLLAEKAQSKEKELSDEEAVKALRGEVKKREKSMETYRELGKDEEVEQLKAEISVLGEFLPKQLSPEQVEERVRAYLADHPEIDHPGKLTGALKKELGETVDGKTLNETCRKVLGG